MVAESCKVKVSRRYYPALRGIFGDWVYYSCLMSVAEVSERLSFAAEIHKSKEMSEWNQRRIDEGRSKEIADYLIREPQRFFNSLVVAICGGDPAWHAFSNFKPLADDIDLADVPDDVEASVGFLSLTGQEKMFAIDGQHRLAGMKEAVKQQSELGKDEVSLILVAHKTSHSGVERTRRLFTTLKGK
jgi:DNA sulfur modification protein DndB